MLEHNHDTLQILSIPVHNLISKNMSISKIQCSYCKKIPFNMRSCSKCKITSCIECMKDYKKCLNCDNIHISYPLISPTIQLEMKDVKLKCEYQNCKNEVYYYNYQSHLKLCDFRTVKCDCCDQIFTLSEKNKHLMNPNNNINNNDIKQNTIQNNMKVTIEAKNNSLYNIIVEEKRDDNNQNKNLESISSYTNTINKINNFLGSYKDYDKEKLKNSILSSNENVNKLFNTALNEYTTMGNKKSPTHINNSVTNIQNINIEMRDRKDKQISKDNIPQLNQISFTLNNKKKRRNKQKQSTNKKQKNIKKGDQTDDKSSYTSKSNESKTSIKSIKKSSNQISIEKNETTIIKKDSENEDQILLKRFKSKYNSVLKEINQSNLELYNLLFIFFSKNKIGLLKRKPEENFINHLQVINEIKVIRKIFTDKGIPSDSQKDIETFKFIKEYNMKICIDEDEEEIQNNIISQDQSELVVTREDKANQIDINKNNISLNSMNSIYKDLGLYIKSKGFLTKNEKSDKKHDTFITTICFIPNINKDNDILLAGMSDGIINVWIVNIMKIKYSFKEHKGKITSIKIIPQIKKDLENNSNRNKTNLSCIFISSSIDMTIRLWRFSYSQLVNDSNINSLYILNIFDIVTNIEVISELSPLLIAASHLNRITFIRIDTFEKLFIINLDEKQTNIPITDFSSTSNIKQDISVSCMLYFPNKSNNTNLIEDRHYLLSCEYPEVSIRLWKIPITNQISNYSFVRSYKNVKIKVNQIIGFDDGDTFATTGCDKNIKIWSKRNLNPILVIHNHHKGYINFMIYVKRNLKEYLISGGDDKKIKVYCYNDKKLINEISVGKKIYTFVYFNYLTKNDKYVIGFNNGFDDKIVLIENNIELFSESKNDE